MDVPAPAEACHAAPVPPQIHFLQATRVGDFKTSALAPAALDRINELLQSRWRWLSDSLSRKAVRDRIVDVQAAAAPAGLVVIGPGVHTPVPPPFAYRFEPIELGANDSQLRTLTGEAPTREERQLKWLGRIGLLLGITIAGWLIGAALFVPRVRTALWIILILGAIVTVVVVAIITLAQQRARWFLVPGGIYLVRPKGARLYPRTSTVLCHRLIHTGKTVIRVMELWTADEKLQRRAVNEREALAILAAWQSAAPIPLLEDLTTVGRDDQ